MKIEKGQSLLASTMAHLLRYKHIKCSLAIRVTGFPSQGTCAHFFNGRSSQKLSEPNDIRRWTEKLRPYYRPQALDMGSLPGTYTSILHTSIWYRIEP